MTTKLDGQLKRELIVLGEPYTLTLSAEGRDGSGRCSFVPGRGIGAQRRIRAGR